MKWKGPSSLPFHAVQCIRTILVVEVSHFFGGFCCVHFWLLGGVVSIQLWKLWYLLLLERCESQQGGLPKTFGVCDMIS